MLVAKYRKRNNLGLVRKFVLLTRSMAGDTLKLNMEGRRGTQDVEALSLHGA